MSDLGGNRIGFISVPRMTIEGLAQGHALIAITSIVDVSEYESGGCSIYLGDKKWVSTPLSYNDVCTLVARTGAIIAQ